MNIICFLWKHDWEIIEKISELNLLTRIESALDDKSNIKPKNRFFYKRVCIRCGIKKDSINDYFTAYLNKRKESKNRKEAAKNLWNNR